MADLRGGRSGAWGSFVHGGGYGACVQACARVMCQLCIPVTCHMGLHVTDRDKARIHGVNMRSVDEEEIHLKCVLAR